MNWKNMKEKMKDHIGLAFTNIGNLDMSFLPHLPSDSQDYVQSLKGSEQIQNNTNIQAENKFMELSYKGKPEVTKNSTMPYFINAAGDLEISHQSAAKFTTTNSNNVKNYSTERKGYFRQY